MEMLYLDIKEDTADPHQKKDLSKKTVGYERQAVIYGELVRRKPAEL